MANEGLTPDYIRFQLYSLELIDMLMNLQFKLASTREIINQTVQTLSAKQLCVFVFEMKSGIINRTKLYKHICVKNKLN